MLSSCDATLAKSPLAFEIARDWMASKDPFRRSCGYGLVYELAKNQKDKRLTDEFFLACVEKIGKTIWQPGNGGSPHEVAMTVDVDRYFQHFFEVVG